MLARRPKPPHEIHLGRLRHTWWKERRAATAFAFRVQPATAVADLREATASALAAARKALPGRGGVRVRADMQPDGVEIVVRVQLQVSGVTPEPEAWIARVRQAFTTTFVQHLPAAQSCNETPQSADTTQR